MSHHPLIHPSYKYSRLPCKGQILIQNDVWLGFSVTVPGGVTIHNGAVAAMNSHIVKDVPPYAIVGGNPAKLIKYRFTDEQIADLLDIAWWDWDDTAIGERAGDFQLPVSEFISKYKTERARSGVKPRASGNTVFLFFPDFDDAYPIWQQVVAQYCAAFGDDASKTLMLCIAQDPDTKYYLGKLEKYLPRVYSGGGDIAVQLGGSEEEFFAQADYYITTRAVQTVRRSCLADRYGCKTLSGVDIPLFHPLVI